MNNKTCDEMMDIFFSLDKNERYPLRLTLHLLSCAQCRTQVRLCTLAEKICAEPLARPADEADVMRLMARVRQHMPEQSDTSPISLRRWIVSGVTMILAMMLFAVISPKSSGNYLQLAFYLVFAGAVTAYCAIFIASNMDFFIKKIETIRSSGHEGAAGIF
jgi:hypothetical protein